MARPTDEMTFAGPLSHILEVGLARLCGRDSQQEQEEQEESEASNQVINFGDEGFVKDPVLLRMMQVHLLGT